MVWDPASYLRYAEQRSRPFADLMARVAAERPRAVVDLGCGPGNLTTILAARWPRARVTGIDSAPEMIRTAVAATPAADAGPAGAGRYPVEFVVGDVRDWVPGPEDDVVVSNAALQWVPDHEVLLARWVSRMPPGGWLAVQMPGNFDAPAHRALREVAREPRWRDRVGHLVRVDPVADAAGYAALLTGLAGPVDAWETTYLHQLPAVAGADHPVLSWLEGTALRPFRTAFRTAEDGAGPDGAGAEPGDARSAGGGWVEFRSELARRLAEAYPVRAGLVYFPFRRVFLVVRTGAPDDPPDGPEPAGTDTTSQREST